jgi:hypothetical protein
MVAPDGLGYVLGAFEPAIAGVSLPRTEERNMHTTTRFGIAVLTLALAVGSLTAPSYAQTQGADKRQDARDTKQDGRKDAREGKAECKKGEEKTRAECRQDKRDVKEDARDSARQQKKQ